MRTLKFPTTHTWYLNSIILYRIHKIKTYICPIIYSLDYLGLHYMRGKLSSNGPKWLILRLRIGNTSTKLDLDDVTTAPSASKYRWSQGQTMLNKINLFAVNLYPTTNHAISWQKLPKNILHGFIWSLEINSSNCRVVIRENNWIGHSWCTPEFPRPLSNVSH